tara:strand:- start:769 stop:1017 length:249 start_codon:yes stop_codon:yes gene_type:complete
MKTILESITSSLITIDGKLHKHETLAIKNLVEVAKERIWIADQLDATEYDTIKFNEHLSVDEVHVIKQSIRVLENLLSKTNS